MYRQIWVLQALLDTADWRFMKYIQYPRRDTPRAQGVSTFQVKPTVRQGLKPLAVFRLKLTNCC